MRTEEIRGAAGGDRAEGAAGVGDDGGDQAEGAARGGDDGRTQEIGPEVLPGAGSAA